jgi:hypothetical protein
MKRMFVWILMLFALVLSVSAADTLTATDVSLTIAEGVTVAGTTTLANTGDTDLSTVSISSSDLSDGTNTIAAAQVTFSTITTPLTQGNSQTVTVTVAVPSSQVLGTYTGTLTATYNSGGADSTVTSTLTVVVVAQAPDFDLPASLTFDEEFSNTTVSKTFTVTNNGNTPLTGITVTSDADVKYSVVFTNVPTSLAIGSNQVVTVTATTPITELPGTKSIGNVNVSSTEKSETFSLSVDVRGRLAIDDLDIRVGSESSNNLDNNDKIGDDARPEDTVKFDITVENRYSRDDDVDIDDVTVKVTIEDIDDGDDMEEEADEFDLNPKEREEVQLIFDLPLEIEEGDYNVVVEIEGEDDNGNTLSETWSLILVVDKKTHAVQIKRASLSQSEITQGQTTILTTEIINLGSRNEDEVVLEIKNSNLDINFKEVDIELDNDLTDDDSKYRKTITISTADDLVPGTYSIDIRVYYDDDNLDDLTTVDLVIKAKQSTTVTPPTTNDDNDDDDGFQVITPTGTTDTDDTTTVADTTTTTTTVTETKESFFDSPLALYLAGLGVIVVVLLGGIAVLLFKLIGGGIAK